MWAAEADSTSHASQMITATDEHGRKIYVNDETPVQRHAAPAAQPKRTSLVYWSSKDNRWKPVPSVNTASMQAARSAAAEVTQYFGHESAQSANAKIVSANARGHQASQEDIDSSIVMAAHIFFIAQLRKEGSQFVIDLKRDRVQALGTIERNRRDAILCFEEKRFRTEHLRVRPSVQATS